MDVRLDHMARIVENDARNVKCVYSVGEADAIFALNTIREYLQNITV